MNYTTTDTKANGSYLTCKHCSKGFYGLDLHNFEGCQGKQKAVQSVAGEGFHGLHKHPIMGAYCPCQDCK